jgi:hypothetical protein
MAQGHRRTQDSEHLRNLRNLWIVRSALAFLAHLAVCPFLIHVCRMSIEEETPPIASLRRGDTACHLRSLRIVSGSVPDWRSPWVASTPMRRC